MRLWIALTLVSALAASACHRHRPSHFEDVRGVDGHEWKKYSCPHLDARCFAVARKYCPNGYYFAKNPVAVEASSESPQASREASPTGRAKTLPPQEKWGHEMYSDAPGTLMVRCADDPAKDPT